MLRLRSSVLVMLVTVVLAETIRVVSALGYVFAADLDDLGAGLAVLTLLVLALLGWPLARFAGARMLLIVGVGGLAAARVLLQVLDPVLPVAVVGLVLGMIGLAAALRRALADDGPVAAGAALFVGLTIDAGIRIALTTWDAAWQSTPFAWAVGLVLPALVGWALITVLQAPSEDAGSDSWRLAAVPGALLALQTLFLSSPGFVASSADVSLPVAGAAVLLGLGVAAAMPAVRGWNVWNARILLVVVAASLTGPTGLDGPAVNGGILIGQACAGALVSTAIARVSTGESRSEAWRTGLGTGLGLMVLAAVLVSYQLSYEISTDVPHFGFVVLGSVVLVLLAGSAPPEDLVRPAPRSLRWAAALSPVPVLLVPLWSELTWPEPAGTDSSTSVRVATYNIHSGINWDGQLDPEGIATVLEDGDAEVMMLQEVARGWPRAGGLDTAAWLSRRLGADFAYGGAADHQFGNAVLSTRTIVSEWSATMPPLQGTMQRGYVGAGVVVGDTTIDVWSTHLEDGEDRVATCQAHAEEILRVWDGADRTIFGGDLNAGPDSPGIEPWFDGTGLHSAQDDQAGPDRSTEPALDPDRQIDWILGTPDLQFADVAVPQTLSSDHLPVFATVTIAGDSP